MRYRDVEGVFFPAGNSAVVCGSPCVFPRSPGHKMWLVEDGVAREAPELWPERASAAELRRGGGWARNVAYMRRKGLVDTVHFSGEYPGALFAEALESCQVHDGAQREVQFHADGWMEPASLPAAVRLKPLPPRALYPALASAPVGDDPRRTFVYGADSAPMVAEEERLCVYNDAAWHCSDAPWGWGVSLWRLADGRTLALSGDAHLIEPDGAISRVEVADPHFTTVVDMGGVAWLAGRGRLSKPVHPERFRLFDADAGKYEGPRPPAIVVPIPEGDELTQGCATPAVVMQRQDGMPPRVDEVLRREVGK